MSVLYPLKFNPIFKEKIWGGQKIRTVLGKNCASFDHCGETWELSGVPDHVSKVATGPLKTSKLSSLIQEWKGDLVGHAIYEQFQNNFPLLIKFIDAAQDLSIQVHPNDILAMERHNCRGKSEMWYVLQADLNAQLIDGFSKDTTKEAYQQCLHEGKPTAFLNFERVEKGDVFYLPAGRVHNIGKGILIVEIQETSDITYRIHDFDRVDKDNKKRELHIAWALDAIDYRKADQVKNKYSNTPNQPHTIVSSPHFTTNKLIVDQDIEINRPSLDCFKVYIGVGGTGKIAGVSITFGEVMLVPAVMKNYHIHPEGRLELLETYIHNPK